MREIVDFLKTILKSIYTIFDPLIDCIDILPFCYVLETQICQFCLLDSRVSDHGNLRNNKGRKLDFRLKGFLAY